jgi:alkylation response protein AidB-like acyl-CoA dehydrogenase
MDFELSAEQKKIRAACRELAADFATRAAQHDRETSLPLENYEALKNAGLYGLTVPREFGGLGGGFLGHVIAMDEIAQGCAATALTFNMHSALGNLFVPPATDLIDAGTRRRVARLIVEDKKLICAGLSEPGVSSLLLGPTYSLSVQCRRVPGGYRVSGKKTFQSMLEASDLVLLIAHPEEEPNPMTAAWFLIDRPGPGQRVERVWDTIGMRATCSNNLILDDCFVPEERLVLVTEDLAVAFAAIPNWFGAYAAVYLGVAAAAYAEACRVLRARVPRGFAQPMSYHPAIRRRVAEMSMDLEAARLLLYHSAWKFDTEGPTAAARASFFRAKAFIGEAAGRITRTALTLCGAHALFKDSPLERLFRDAASSSIMPPQSDFCLDVVGAIELGLDWNEMLPPLKLAR